MARLSPDPLVSQVNKFFFGGESAPHGVGGTAHIAGVK